MYTVPKYPMRRDQFVKFLTVAVTGEKIIYHIGNLMRDRTVGRDFQTIHSTAYTAWEAMEAGKALLVQHQITPGVFEYISIKLGGVLNPVKWRGCYAAR